MPIVPIPKDFRCSITLELFADPVVTADGLTYSRLAIERQFADGKDKSPLTNEPLPNRNLIPNKLVKSQVESFRETVLSASKFKAAILAGDLKTLESSAFLPLDEYDDIGPLFLAVRSNQLTVLRYLIQQFGDQSATVKDDAGNSLLHRAGNSSPEMVRYLVGECKLSIEQKNRAAYTPLLQMLAEDALIDVVQELLTAGADPKASTDTANVFVVGPISENLVELLVKFGAGVPAVVEQWFQDGQSVLCRPWSSSRSGARLFERFLSLIPTEARRVAMVRRIKYDGATLLHKAVCNPDILKLILAPPYSLCPKSIDKAGRTPLHYWSMPSNSSDASEETLSMLLAAGTDINAKSQDGRTALHCVVSDVVRFHQLMAAGADASIKNADGNSAFADGKSAFELLSNADLRIMYSKSIDVIKNAAVYIGKKIEALDYYPSGLWLPASIQQVRIIFA
jgi:ankyrin repeat protein